MNLIPLEARKVIDNNLLNIIDTLSVVEIEFDKKYMLDNYDELLLCRK